MNFPSVVEVPVVILLLSEATCGAKLKIKASYHRELMHRKSGQHGGILGLAICELHLICKMHLISNLLQFL